MSKKSLKISEPNGTNAVVICGATVHTFKDTMPISYGVVELISECGRYAKVRKTYGTKSWIKDYLVSELHRI